MMSTIESINYNNEAMAGPRAPACDAWRLLVRFFFDQRTQLPSLAADLELSPAQCHVLHLIEPGRPVPMGKLAQTLACDASNVTGLVDRLESRGLLRRRPSNEDRRIKVLVLTESGARLRATLLDRMTSPPAALERLSAREQRMLVRLLQQMLE